ncbi:MAG: BatA domain-containing protein [Cyclobacteriaceae bacterium]
MTILQSTYLIGLAGLLVPVLIHLWSRKNRSPIPFSSIRFISSSSQRSLRKITPSDPWMLLLRSLLVLLLIALLSDIRINQWTKPFKSILYVDSVYSSNSLALSALEKASDTAEVKWLPKMAPELRIGTWKTLADENTLFFSPWNPYFNTSSDDALKGLDIRRLPMQDLTIDIGGALINSEVYALDAILNEQSIRIHRSKQTNKIASISYYFPPNDDYKELSTILRSALDAINTKGIYQLLEVSKTEEADLVITLENDINVSSKKTLAGQVQVEPWSKWSNEIATFSLNMTKVTALQSNFVNELYNWLNPYSEMVAEYDIRTTDDKEINPIRMANDQPRLLSWLWWSILLTGIGLERWLALK